MALILTPRDVLAMIDAAKKLYYTLSEQRVVTKAGYWMVLEHFQS